MRKIYFQGTFGAYSHLAALSVDPDAEILPCKTFDDCFDKATLEPDCKIIIPESNRITGNIGIEYLIFIHRLNIYMEHFQKIEHNLLGQPNANLNDIKDVFSHSQGLSQCSNFIKKNNFAEHIRADTAGSAKNISESNILDTAAIASKLAADIYSLKIVDDNFANSINNITRFFIMSQEPNNSYDEKKNYISAFLFSVKNTPGSLFKVMGGFATNNVNMIKLESYNYGEQFTITEFYCEIEGHPSQHNTKLALDDLNHYCSKVKNLGVFEKSLYRSRQ